MALAELSAMDCYFGSIALPKENQLRDKSVIVTFSIPEVGITFKAPFAAVDPVHGNLAALLALLEFIDNNQKYFPDKTFQIFGNDLKVINGVNRKEQLPNIFTPLLGKAFGYRKKYRFSLDWVPTKELPENISDSL